MFGAAIVLLHADDLGVGKVLLEVEDVGDVGAAKAVDGLVVVTDHCQVAVLRGQHPQQLVLRPVGVLVLVDHDVLELLAVLIEDVRVLLEEPHGHADEVVEVHGV